MTDTKTDSLAQAVAVLQTRLPRIEKSQTADVPTKNGGSYSYSYADLAQITRELMPILGDLGLSFIAKPTTTADGRFVLAYKLLHVSGESEEGEYPLPSGSSPQAMGSAITYARRYCLCAVTGVAAEDDDEAAAAQAEAAGQRGTASRASTPRQRAQSNGGQRAARHSPPADRPPLPGETGEAVTDPQIKKILALFSQTSWADRDDRLRAASALAGRPLASSTDMTKREASKVIDALEQVTADPDPDARLTEMVAAASHPEGSE